MKKTITLLAAGYLTLATYNGFSQQVVSDFENFTLPTQTFYQDSTGADWQTSTAIFQYNWDTMFDYWENGFSYTNVLDSTTGDYTNLYGNITGKGYNNSTNYVTMEYNSMIKLKSPYNTVNGFWLTNSTYAYKTIKNGSGLSKKFGGVTGNDPDWFCLTVYGYRNGSKLQDSVNFYLADFRFSNNSQDYIINNWQWVDCLSIGVVDSIECVLNSTDNNSFGMLTPAYACLDDFTVSQISTGIDEVSTASSIIVYPNPAKQQLHVSSQLLVDGSTISIYNYTGKLLYTTLVSDARLSKQTTIDVEYFSQGMYILEVKAGNQTFISKFIKE